MDILVICQPDGIVIGLTTILLVQTIVGLTGFHINIVKVGCFS